MQTRSKQTLGTIIFLVGLFVGLGLAVSAIWGDYEAMSYFYNGAGYDAFGGLSCPVIMSPSEVAPVSAHFDNPDDEEIRPYYKVEIGATAFSRHLEDQFALPAHSAKTITWSVDINDLNLGSFILLKMDVLPVAGYSTREATCGILVLGLMGLKGTQILWSTLAFSLLGLVIGLGLREGTGQALIGRELSARNGMRAAGVSTLLALLAGLMGWWLFGVVFCAVTVLLLVIMLRYAVS